MICSALDLIFSMFFQLLVQFVQNTSIPLGQGLVESEPKDITCLSLLPVTETSECNRLMLPGKICVADLCDPALHTPSLFHHPSPSVLLIRHSRDGLKSSAEWLNLLIYSEVWLVRNFLLPSLSSSGAFFPRTITSYILLVIVYLYFYLLWFHFPY